MQIVNLKKPGKPFELQSCGLCLGNFDGVHRGHRALVEELKRQNAAREQHLYLGALLFAQPPSSILSPITVPQLTTLDEKLKLLGDMGLHFAVLYDFAELKDMSPDDFVKQVLIKQCHCRLAVCGFNYTYGAKGAGNVARLQETFGATPGCTLSVVDAVTDGPHTVSSSLIRSMLENGHPEDAARLLGRPYSLQGKVTHGRHVGTTMGFPTANLAFPSGSLIPMKGVYLSCVRIARHSYFAISNVGRRPTFENDGQINCETFIFHYNGDLYGREIQVSFLRFLREEKKFNSVAELEAQIKHDIEQANLYIV